LLVDFHSHTYESDGTLAPQALADFMGERGVEIFAISDHDSLAAYGQFVPPPGARVVTGIEINTSWRNNEVHVLGYRLPVDDAAFNALLEANRSARRVRVERIVHQLRAAGYGITMAEVEREAVAGAALGRPHVAKALIRGGHFDDIESIFRMLLTRGRSGYVPSTHIAPHEAIAAIHAAGGLAVLAHPGRLKDGSIIEELVEDGLDGLEVFYPRHDAGDVAHFRAIAEKFGLVMTGGSDFHDIRYHTEGVGMHVPDGDIAPFLERALA
jgi:predicted metal-dependent phosphoesterase TrpH